MATVLIVEDNPSLREILVKVLQKDKDLEVHNAGDGESALEMIKTFKYDVVISDIKMPFMDGIELLQRVKKYDNSIVMIMITAHGTVQSAVKAMKLGAHDYLTKPFSNEEFRMTIQRALKHRTVLEENRFYKEREQASYSFENIVGQSRSMQNIFKVVRKVAKTNANVLIQGDTGTGKELLAHAIHLLSARRDKLFVAMNCAVFAPGVLESELFGHERGAFTGADSRKIGRFELASGGTLFLDEVGEISQNMQVKLLRVLQERVFERDGGTAEIKSEARIIAATNKNLEDEVTKGNFRKDLFYRLNVVAIHIPALRFRKDDIPLLVSHFINKYGQTVAPKVVGISDRAMQHLIDYDWPGNIRELENVIERAIVLSEDKVLDITDFPNELQFKKDKVETADFGEAGTLEQKVEQFERMEILKALQRNNNNKSKAALDLGLKRTTLLYKISRYGLKQVMSS